MIDTKLVLDYVTLGIAVFGAALSVVNTVFAWRGQRTRLKVEPRIARVNFESLRLCVVVTNLSAHAVTLTQFSLGLKRSRLRIGFGAELLPGDSTPIRLEPRTQVTVVVPAWASEQEDVRRVRSVVVETGCGGTYQGHSSALRWYVRNLPRAARADEMQHLRAEAGAFVTSPHGPPKTTF